MDYPNSAAKGRPASGRVGQAGPPSFGYTVCAVALLMFVVWRLPGGNYFLYPFTIFATWFHEMGHGLTAAALGATFTKLALHGDGSGLAHYQHASDFAPWKKALVSAAGPLGPSVFGTALIPLATRAMAARISLLVLSGTMLYSAVFIIAGLFGTLVIGIAGLVIIYLALRATAEQCRLLLLFIALQACISGYRNLDYVFAEEAAIDGLVYLSDVSVIARELGGPHWFWGAIIAATGFIFLGAVLAAMVAPQVISRLNTRRKARAAAEAPRTT